MTALSLRNQAIRLARSFFQHEQLLEVRTNCIVSAPAMEPYIDAFAVNANDRTQLGHLATSPEFSMKRIFADEIRDAPEARGIYEITPVFRDDRPGKNHAVEFTMLEWYTKDCTLEEILRQSARLIAFLAKGLSVTDISAEYDTVHAAKELQRIIKKQLPETNFPYSTLYRQTFGTMPSHLNALDAEITCFNLLFDSLLLPEIKHRQGLVAVTGYPDCLAAMARVKDREALRSELFYNGLELANAYLEEHEADTIRARWTEYNTIRGLRKLPEHTSDEQLLANLSAMKGVSGVAVGLERLLMVFYPHLRATDFR